MREVAKDRPVAVVGAGTMGRGIVQVFAAAGFDVQVFDASRGGGRGRPGVDQETVLSWRPERADDQGRGRRGDRADSFCWCARRLRLGPGMHRGGDRATGDQERDFSGGRRRPSRRRHSRDQYEQYQCDRVGGGDAVAVDVHRHALFQSGAGDEARRGGDGARYRRRHPRSHPRAG